MTKQAEGWAVIGPRQKWPVFYADTEDRAWEEAERKIGGEVWALKDIGYRCVPVTVEWEEK